MLDAGKFFSFRVTLILPLPTFPVQDEFPVCLRSAELVEF